MRADIRIAARVVAIAALAALVPAAAAAQKSNNYNELYERYLASARRAQVAPQLWMVDLTSDRRARNVNDLVTIRVLESLTATGAADSTVNKNSSGDIAVTGKLDEYLNKLLPTSANTKFTGSGGTSRTTELSATLTARVVEVLPSGDLVVEGVREVNINGDRNLVVLSGVMRPDDILPGNVIPSSRIGQLQIRSLSQGLIKDSLTPGWLIRVLNKIF